MMLKDGLIHLTNNEHDKRPLSIGKNKKVIGLFKDELGGKIMKEFCALRYKTYSYLMDDGSEVKKSKETKKCVIKQGIVFESYTGFLFKSARKSNDGS